MSTIKTVYDHIRSNNIKTFILLAMFPLSFIVLLFIAFTFSSPQQEALATSLAISGPIFAICAIWMLISWAFGDSMMLNIANATEIKPDDSEYREIFRSVENISLAAGLPTPRVYIIHSNSLNAFATGRSPRDASIALTSGIIKRLNKSELDGVIAHEMAHIGNRDIRLDMLMITGVGVTVFIANILWYTATHNIGTRDKEKQGVDLTIWLCWLVLSIFNVIIVPVLRMAVSRNREYAADATGAHITRNPNALASALRKISDDSRLPQLDRAKTMASACIAFPGNPRAFFGELLATHPPIASRIKRLESMTIKQ